MKRLEAGGILHSWAQRSASGEGEGGSKENGGGERKRLIIPRHDTQYEEKDAVRIQRRVWRVRRARARDLFGQRMLWRIFLILGSYSADDSLLWRAGVIVDQHFGRLQVWQGLAGRGGTNPKITRKKAKKWYWGSTNLYFTAKSKTPWLGNWYSASKSVSWRLHSASRGDGRRGSGDSVHSMMQLCHRLVVCPWTSHFTFQPTFHLQSQAWELDNL